MNKDEALKLALEALRLCTNVGMIPMYLQANQTAITAIKEALVQDALDRKAENARELGLDYEPVAFASHGVVNWIADKQFQYEADLYITSQRTWVGLSDVNAIELWQLARHDIVEFARVIEAKLKESNTSLS
jgi:hypothetical protein